MRNLPFIIVFILIATGCENKSERFDDLLQVAGAQFFIRELPDEIKKNGEIDFGYRENGKEIRYIGTFYPEEDSNSIDLYFFANPMRIGFVSGSKSGVMPIKLPENVRFDTTISGAEKGKFTEPLITLMNSRDRNETGRTGIVFVLYNRE